MSSAYDDFLNLPHHVSADLPHMSMQNRAAQFAPFAALVGYDALIQETARLTDHRAELDESEKAALDRRLQLLYQNLLNAPRVSITYFQPDAFKDGGSYQTVTGIVRKWDEYHRRICMDNGTLIPVDEIFAVDGRLFQKME